MREHKIWKEVLERFEQQAPSAVMTHLALDQALPSIWIDEVFLEHRQRQYPCELLLLLWSNLPSDIDAATIASAGASKACLVGWNRCSTARSRKRKPKAVQAKGYVDGSIARVLKQAMGKRP